MAELKKFFRGIGNSNRGRRQSVEDGPELIIVVMGATGTGKSSLINALTKSKSASVSDGLESETNAIKVTSWTFSRRRFKIVDTPGFDDTKLSDATVLRMIADFLQASFGRRVFVNGIIYLHRIIDPRITGTAVKNLQLLQDLCGDQVKNVLLVTTFWDLVPKGQGDKREAELANNYWRPLIELGSRMHRYHRQKSSGEEFILDILDHQSNIIELQLQIELTQAERTLLHTMAGRRLQEGLNHQLEQLGMTLNQVQEEQYDVDGRRSIGRDDINRFNAHERRILDEMSAIEHDLEILGMPRDMAMQEIDDRVAEIVNEKGRDEVAAFWDLYSGDGDESSGIDSPRESLGINRGQPTSPGYKSIGYGDQQFAHRSIESSQRKPSSPGGYDSPDTRRRDSQVGRDNRPHISNDSPFGQARRESYSEPDFQAFEELSINTKHQFGRYDR